MSEDVNVIPETEPVVTAKRPGMMKRLYLWVLHWADTPYGTPALFLLAFAESSFFPIPPDVLQMALSVSRPRRSFYYATVSGVASVLGALLGYCIGYAFWVAAQNFFFHWVPGFTPEVFELVKSKYDQNAFAAIAIAGFTPIPFKVFTITAGVCEIPLLTLLLASILSRFARFYLVAGFIFVFGPQIKVLLDKYLGLITIVLTLMVIAGFLAIKLLL